MFRRTQAFTLVLFRLLRPYEIIFRPTNVDGLLVYRFAGPLFFFNASHFARRVNELIDTADNPVTFFLINAEAIVDVDSVGVEVLSGLYETMQEKNVTLGFCEVKGHFREALLNMPRQGNFIVYPSVKAALRELSREKSMREHTTDASNEQLLAS